MIFYSQSAGGFYSTEVHGSNMPSDVVSVTAEQYQALLTGQSQGKQITAGPSGPVLTDPTASAAPSPTPEQIAALRRAAYQAEADPLFFKSQRGEASEAEWLAKVQEIKARFPE